MVGSCAVGDRSYSRDFTTGSCRSFGERIGFTSGHRLQCATVPEASCLPTRHLARWRVQALTRRCVPQLDPRSHLLPFKWRWSLSFQPCLAVVDGAEHDRSKMAGLGCCQNGGGRRGSANAW